jgi:hypothetical protein
MLVAGEFQAFAGDDGELTVVARQHARMLDAANGVWWLLLPAIRTNSLFVYPSQEEGSKWLWGLTVSFRTVQVLDVRCSRMLMVNGRFSKHAGC